MPATSEAVALTVSAALAAADKKAQRPVALDVSDHLFIIDTFFIVSAGNERQVRAIVDGIEERIFLEHNSKPLRREGQREGRWVVLDYGDLMVHVQLDSEREQYQLERLWRDCPLVELPAEVYLSESDAPVGAGPSTLR